MIYRKFIYLIPISGVFLILFAPYSAYASGPRFDFLDDATDQERTCYRDGYEQGFAGMYDSDRASECYTEGGDEYNKMWNYACLYTGRSESQCNDIASNPQDVQETIEELGQKNKQSCFDSGYDDGLDHPYDNQRSKACNDYGSQYYHGFIAGCTAVANNNTEEICERFTDAYDLPNGASSFENSSTPWTTLALTNTNGIETQEKYTGSMQYLKKL